MSMSDMLDAHPAAPSAGQPITIVINCSQAWDHNSYTFSANMPDTRLLSDLSALFGSAVPSSKRTPSPATPAGPSPRPVPAPSGAAGGPEEQRAKRGDDNYVTRPPNAFMLFRSWCCKNQAENGDRTKKGDLNKMVPEQWKALSPEGRAKWIALAKEKEKEHRMRYPDYKYCPQRRNAKNRVSAVTPSTAQAQDAPPHTASQIPNMPTAIFLPAQSPLTDGTSGILSPTSSTFDSAPSSPYMPASASLHSPAFSGMPAAAATALPSETQTCDVLRVIVPAAQSPTSAPLALAGIPASNTPVAGPPSPCTHPNGPSLQETTRMHRYRQRPPLPAPYFLRAISPSRAAAAPRSGGCPGTRSSGAQRLTTRWTLEWGSRRWGGTGRQRRGVDLGPALGPSLPLAHHSTPN